MPRVIQVIAEYAGGPHSTADNRYRLTFHGVIDNEDKLGRRRFYGAVSEPLIGDYPFIMEPPKSGKQHGTLKWGGSFASEDINIFGKDIVLNEQFTRWAAVYRNEDDEKPAGYKEWVYRIVRIDDLGLS